MLKQLYLVTFTLLIFFVSLFVYIKIAGPLPFSVNSVTTSKSTTFDVSGEGKVTIQPDGANISAGVMANGASVQQVQTQMNTIINKVSSSEKSLGIDPKDIQTAQYSVTPIYDYSLGSQNINGYSATTTLTIKVRDITKINSSIDAATAAGATNVDNLGFTNSDTTVAENQARKIAVAQAKKKAEDAASIAGFSLGNIVNYSENFGGTPRIMPLNAENANIGSAPVTKLEPGSNEVQVDVTLSYEIR